MDERLMWSKLAFSLHMFFWFWWAMIILSWLMESWRCNTIIPLSSARKVQAGCKKRKHRSQKNKRGLWNYCSTKKLSLVLAIETQSGCVGKTKRNQSVPIGISTVWGKKRKRKRQIQKKKLGKILYQSSPTGVCLKPKKSRSGTFKKVIVYANIISALNYLSRE